MKLTKGQLARLETLENARGKIAPSRVVEDARRQTSPLHSLFDWNIKRAAEKHWLHRAREIVASVTLVITTNETTVRVPKYVRDPESKGNEEGYRSVVALKADPVNARESLVYTLDVAAGHLRRAFDLAQPLGLENEIDALLAQVAGVQRRLKPAA